MYLVMMHGPEATVELRKAREIQRCGDGRDGECPAGRCGPLHPK